MDLIKGLTSKIASGVIAASVIALVISWWRSDEATRQMLLSGAGRIASWVGIVIVLPWASFFLIGKIARLESNGAGAAFVLSLTLLEAILLAWLFTWHFAGATGWTFAAAATLIAGVYNLFACDWIAEKLET